MKYRKTRELKWIRIYLISTFGFIVTGPVMGFIDNGYTYGKFVAVFSLVYFTVLVWQSVATSRVFGSDYTVFKADRTNPDELAEILGIIEARKMFIQKDFSLEQFSYFLNKPKQEINSLFKQNLQINFTEYINQIRVKESISMLQSEKFDHYKVDAIGLEAGFSSRSSFYEAFKKETGLTPSEFRNQTRELKN
ncbi:MAG: AraC family transcriptional regulator [Bacteroidales bacterium]